MATHKNIFPMNIEIVQTLSKQSKMCLRVMSADGNLQMVASDADSSQWAEFVDIMNNVHAALIKAQEEVVVLRDALRVREEDKKEPSPTISSRAGSSGEQQKAVDATAVTGHKLSADETHPNIQYKIVGYSTEVVEADDKTRLFELQRTVQIGSIIPHRPQSTDVIYQVEYVGTPESSKDLAIQERNSLNCPLCFGSAYDLKDDRKTS